MRRRKVVRKTIGHGLHHLRRNFTTIENLLSKYPANPLKHREQEDFETIKKVFGQQDQMYSTLTHSVPDRMVSIPY